LNTSFTASDGSSQQKPGSDSAFEAFYTCIAGESFTFKKSGDNFMVDAATVNLTASKSGG
jgi:hypothetical protein